MSYFPFWSNEQRPQKHKLIILNCMVWLHCNRWNLWCDSGCSRTLSHSYSYQNRELHFIMACWEFPTISLCSWPPTLHCMYKERVLVWSGSMQLCQADRSARCALCCSVCTATPLFCPLRWSPAATPHHCVWQTSNLIPWQFRRLSVSPWNNGAISSEYTCLHLFAFEQNFWTSHKT